MLIGHDAPFAAFHEAWRTGRLHHAWLLTGPRGMGKAALAHRIARFLLTRGPGASGDAELDGDPALGRLVDQNTHPELLLLQREERKEKARAGEVARNITIDQVRGMLGRLTMSIGLGNWRVIIIDALDELEPSAANALLKTLEEPPARTLFLLISHSPGRLLPTIRSRCRQLRVQPIDDDAMLAWLRRQKPELPDRDRQTMAMAARGVPGAAMELADSAVGEIEAQLTAIAASGDPDNRLREAFARSLSGSAAKRRYEAMLVAAPALMAGMARRDGAGERAASVIAQWERVDRLTGDAVRHSYDPAMTAFAVASAFAALASPAATQRFP